MSVHVAAGTHHTYRANEHDTLLSEVVAVQCVLMPRAFLVAGFGENGKVIIARYCGYAATDPEWDPHFFGHEFMTETLLGVPQQVKSIFVGSDVSMLIPTALYTEEEARGWLGKIQSLSPADVLHAYPVESPEAQYVFAVPEAIDKLLQRYFGGTPLLPVAAYQFYKPARSGYIMQCLLAEDKTIASLHHMGRLLWHQQFAGNSAEDIAWQAGYLCRELHIPRIDLNIQFAALSDDHYHQAAELERYFPKIRWSVNAPGDGGDWAPVIYLLQQLYACAL
jgi:hypothetical protein